MPVLSLVLKIDLHMFREGFKIPVIPYQADLIYKHQGVRGELDPAEILRFKWIDAGNLPVTEYGPAFFLVLDCKLGHKGCFTGALLAKNHIELVGIPVFHHMIQNKEEEQEQEGLQANE